MSLKENLLKVIDSALDLAAECEQTIEVRGAVKQLSQAKGQISQISEPSEALPETPVVPIEAPTAEDIVVNNAKEFTPQDGSSFDTISTADEEE